MQRLATPGLWEARAFGCRRGALGSGCKRTSAGHGVELHHEGGAGASESHDEAGEHGWLRSDWRCSTMRCDVVVLLAQPLLFSAGCSSFHLDSDGRPRPTKAPCTRRTCCGCDGQQTFFFSFVPFFFFSSSMVGGQQSRQGRGCWCCMKLTSRQRQKGLGRVEIGSLKQRGPWMTRPEWVSCR